MFSGERPSFVCPLDVGDFDVASALQCFAALPNFPERRFPAEPFFEYDRSVHPLRDGVTVEKFEMKNGYLDIPEQPGLGVSLDPDFIEKHAL